MDFWKEALTRGEREGLAVAEAGHGHSAALLAVAVLRPRPAKSFAACEWKDNGRGDHWSGQGATACFVHADQQPL
jgi:hypothetical protein